MCRSDWGGGCIFLKCLKFKNVLIVLWGRGATLFETLAPLWPILQSCLSSKENICPPRLLMLKKKLRTTFGLSFTDSNCLFKEEKSPRSCISFRSLRVKKFPISCLLFGLPLDKGRQYKLGLRYSSNRLCQLFCSYATKFNPKNKDRKKIKYQNYQKGIYQPV